MLLLNRRFYKSNDFLIGTLILFVIIPTLVMFAYIYWLNVHAMNERLENTGKILMEHMYSNLNGEISRMEAYVNMAANDRALIRKLEETDYQQKGYALKEAFDDIGYHLSQMNRNGSMLYNFLYIPHSEEAFYFYRTYRIQEMEDMEFQDWYVKALAGRGRICWIDVLETNEYPVIRCAKAVVNNETYEITGVLVFEFFGHNVDILGGKRIADEMWAIVDRQGGVFWQSRGFRKYAAENPEEVRHILQFEYDSISPGKILVLDENVNHGNWRMLQLMPQVSYQDEMLQKGVIIGIVLLGCMAFYGGYLILLQRNFTVPLQSLVNLFNEIEAEDLALNMEKFSCYEMLRLSKGVITLVEKRKTSEAELEHSKKQQNMLQVDMLRARMNPHFIYNVLNMVKYRALLVGQPELAKTLNALIKLLKGSINRDGDFYPLEDECRLIRDFILLQGEIHSREIVLREEIEDAAKQCKVPCLILQPLVENAVLYGIDPKNKEHFVQITAGVKNGRLYLSVYDNGSGIPKERLEALQKPGVKMSNMGIRGVQERISLIYGEEGEVWIQSGQEQGTRIEIRIPAKV